jgi:hypothetical protein
VDPVCGPLEVPGGRVVRYAHRRLVAEAAIDLAELCAGAGGAVALHVSAAWQASLQPRLAEAGLSTGARASVVIADGTSRDGLAVLDKTTTVILIGGRDAGADWVAAGRAAGARVIRPLLGPVLAAKLAASEALADRLRRTTAPEQIDSLRIVDTFVAAGADDVVVDDAVLPTRIVSAGTAAPELAAHAAARLRLRSMIAGIGNL